jgi:hypothetical protein
MFDWSAIVVPKAGSVETCTRYDVAPVDAFQVNVAFVATPVAPLVGVARTGTGGGGGVVVVKLNAPEYALVPPPFDAFTRQ